MLLSVKAERQKPLMATVAIAAGIASIDRDPLLSADCAHQHQDQLHLNDAHYFLTHKVRYPVDKYLTSDNHYQAVFRIVLL